MKFQKGFHLNSFKNISFLGISLVKDVQDTENYMRYDIIDKN